MTSASFETNFFRIAGTSEAETSVSGKAECLLAIREDKTVIFLKSPSPLKKIFLGGGALFVLFCFVFSFFYFLSFFSGLSFYNFPTTNI